MLYAIKIGHWNDIIRRAFNVYFENEKYEHLRNAVRKFDYKILGLKLRMPYSTYSREYLNKPFAIVHI